MVPSPTMQIWLYSGHLVWKRRKFCCCTFFCSNLMLPCHLSACNQDVFQRHWSLKLLVYQPSWNLWCFSFLLAIVDQYEGFNKVLLQIDNVGSTLIYCSISAEKEQTRLWWDMAWFCVTITLNVHKAPGQVAVGEILMVIKSDGQLGTQTQAKKCVLTISVWAVLHFCLLIYFLFFGRSFHNMGVYLDFT
jgi:hypothetical protein